MPDPEEDDAVAEEGVGEVEPTEAAEPEPLDPELVLRADKLGYTLDELREMGASAEKAIAIQERKQKAASQPAPEEDDFSDAELDPRLIKHVKGTRAKLAELDLEATERRIENWVEKQMFSSDIPEDMVTPKNRHAIYKALKEVIEKPGSEKKTEAMLYKEAEQIALGEKLKGRASAALKPTATQRPNPAAPKQSAVDRLMARIKAAQ